MSVNRVGGGTPAQKVKTYSDKMDKNAFLNLLVTQLRNQNPLDPMDNTQFISQMAQFSALEQAQNTNHIIKSDSAYGMVNKLVKATYTDKDTNQAKEIVGIVTMARVDGENIYVKVGSIEVPYESVKEVTDVMGEHEQLETINQNFKMSAAFGMIGKDVKAKVLKEGTKNEYNEVAGTVTGVRISSGSIYAQIGDKEVPVDSIYQVNK
jgi:flagellar basal-body rod modification protein FlgD